jgi:hypothetical protein
VLALNSGSSGPENPAPIGAVPADDTGEGPLIVGTSDRRPDT